jgi:hypothetical protein
VNELAVTAETLANPAKKPAFVVFGAGVAANGTLAMQVAGGLYRIPALIVARIEADTFGVGADTEMSAVKAGTSARPRMVVCTVKSDAGRHLAPYHAALLLARPGDTLIVLCAVKKPVHRDKDAAKATQLAASFSSRFDNAKMSSVRSNPDFVRPEFVLLDDDCEVPLNQLLIGAAAARGADYLIVGASTQARATKSICMRVLETARCHTVIAPRPASALELAPAPTDYPPSARATADQAVSTGSSRTATGAFRLTTYMTA